MGHSSCGFAEERDEERPHEGSETGERGRGRGRARGRTGVRAPEVMGREGGRQRWEEEEEGKLACVCTVREGQRGHVNGGPG